MRLAVQRTAAGRRGCNRRALWPPSFGHVEHYEKDRSNFLSGTFCAFSRVVCRRLFCSHGMNMKIPENVGMVYGMFTAHWIGTIMACVLALLLSLTQRRFWFSLPLSLLALLSSYWGVTCIRITRTQTVNGKFQCLFDSRWFFTVSLVLAILALTFAVWKRWRLRYVAWPRLASKFGGLGVSAHTWNL